MALSLHSDADIAERLARTRDYAGSQDIARNIAAAELAHALLDEIADSVRPGQRESEVKAYALDVFSRHGIERTWHPPHVRFGAHTLLTFMDKATQDLMLQEQDICFIDIGIVKDGIEGDAGKTIVLGDHAIGMALKHASEAIFNEARQFWQTQNPTGMALYEFIHRQAALQHCEFRLDPAGHLIGAFPHKGWKRGINHFPETIEGGKWILEIQIRHPVQELGAFYENLLY